MNPAIFEGLGGLYYSENCKRSRPLSREDIARLESEIGNPLPEECAEFLLSYPLGPLEFKNRHVFCRNENGERLSYLDTFYSITDSDACPGRDLRSVFLNTEDLVPRHLLPIIDNGIGDHACIAIAGDRYGAVFTWLHELYEYDGGRGGRPWLEPWELAVAEVAPSFNAFLESLEVDPNPR
jgi:hypothetical protein